MDLAARVRALTDNAGVLAYFGRDGRQGPAVAPGNTAPDPYMGCGSHPDVVERVWDALGGPFRGHGRVLLFGTPALIEPCGLVIAAAFGTAYIIRLLAGDIAAADAAGLHRVRRWSTGASTDVTTVIGPEWRFGAWHKDEIGWVEAVVRDAAVRRGRG